MFLLNYQHDGGWGPLWSSLHNDYITLATKDIYIKIMATGKIKVTEYNHQNKTK